MKRYDYLLTTTPEDIVNTMRKEPSHEVYAIGRHALSEMMQAQMTPYGADSVAYSICELNQAHSGWQLSIMIESNGKAAFYPIPRITDI